MVEACRGRGAVAHPFHEIEKGISKRIHVVPGETDKSSSNFETRVFNGQKCGQLCRKVSNTRKNGTGLLESQTLTMLVDEGRLAH